MCETEIDRLHTSTKKHVYKDRKETTHVEVGEEDIHHHIYIKDKHNVCKHGHKTGVQEEGSNPPNKMKHISSLQRHVFLPLTCRILKKETTYSPQFLPLFVMIDKGYKKLESFTREI